MTILSLCLVLKHPKLIFQMITSTEKFQIIFLLTLADLLWRNLISASQNSQKAKHLALRTYLQWYGNILFKNELLTFCNEALNGSLPSAFSKSSMFTTPTKGDLKLPSNYKGITLTAISAEIYNSLLLNRTSEHIQPILRRNQNGFSKDWSTLPQILVLRRIIEEICTSSRNATLVFIDFSKAFDSVNRKTMLHIMSKMVSSRKL